MPVKKHPWTPRNPKVVPLSSAMALRSAMLKEHVPATDYDDLLWIMAQESGGVVGIKNQQGSSASGLFQLLAAQQAIYYPNGSKSVGNAVEEGQGGIRYIKDRYLTVPRARAFWNKHHWY